MTNINLTVVIPDRDLTVEKFPFATTGVSISRGDDTRVTRNGDTRVTRNGDIRIAHNVTTAYPYVLTAVLGDRDLVVEKI